MVIRIICILLIISFGSSFYSQSDSGKWEKAEISYKILMKEKRDYSFEDLTAGEFLLKAPVFLYQYLASDVDGDNCPFHPSCSSFLIDAVSATNIFQGSLMFFDRFTRDTNFFRNNNAYPFLNNKFYDPSGLYTLSDEQIMSSLHNIHKRVK